MTGTSDPAAGDSDFAEDWFHRSFDALYPLLYRHRDEREAEEFLTRLEGIEPLNGGRVLDLGCGPGRHLAILAARARPVFGLDLSRVLLEQARARAPRVPLVQADMRALPYRSSSFAWLLLLFTTFGYFRDERDDARVLEEAARVLRPGGGLVLDLPNAPLLRRQLVPRSTRIVDGIEVEERRWIDPPFVHKETRIGSHDAGGGRILHERVRLYDPPEVDRLLAAADLAPAVRLGDYGAGAFDPDASPRLLTIARRAGGDR